MSMELHQQKLKDHLAPEEKNILEIQNNMLKATTLLNAWTFDHVIDFNTFTITDKRNHHTRRHRGRGT